MQKFYSYDQLLNGNVDIYFADHKIYPGRSGDSKLELYDVTIWKSKSVLSDWGYPIYMRRKTKGSPYRYLRYPATYVLPLSRLNVVLAGRARRLIETSLP